MGFPKLNRRAAAGINFILILAIIVLVNLVGANSFFKLDLTRSNTYSLSRVSRETLVRLEDPLRVKVFYSEDVPAPYNSVRQYLVDTLREFDAAADDFFSYELVDTSTPEGKLDAQRYGLQQVEIREVRSDEFQSRSVFMGAVVLYGTVVERVDQIASADGLEYRLTTAMISVITQVDALSGTTDNVFMTVIASPSLQQLRMQGFDDFETDMRCVYQRINRDNFGRIQFEFLQPRSIEEEESLEEQYGVRPLKWGTRENQQSQGLLEILLRYGDTVKRIPVEIFRGLLGGYALADPADIEETVRQALRSLVSANPQVAYENSAGEKDLTDYQMGAGPFSMLLSERYEVVPVRLSEDSIPAGIDTLIINGPEQRFTREALYRIDQFLMNGGSLLVFLDRNIQLMPTQQQMLAGAQPVWQANETGLEPLLEHWGVRSTGSFVLDEESFIARQGNRSQQIYQAPVLSGESLNREHVITRGLQDVIVVNATELLPPEDATGTDGTGSADKPVYTALLKTSPESWILEKPEELGPWIQGAPRDADLGRRDIAVLLEGYFSSYFTEPVDLGIPERASRDDETEVVKPEIEPAASGAKIRSRRYAAESLEKGRVLVISSSALTTAQLLNPETMTPNSTFLMNAVDYLNGAPGMAELRSKGLGVPRIGMTSPASRIAARWGNTIMVPLIVVIMGLVVWSRRRARSRRVRMMFENRREP